MKDMEDIGTRRWLTRYGMAWPHIGDPTPKSDARKDGYAANFFPYIPVVFILIFVGMFIFSIIATGGEAELELLEHIKKSLGDTGDMFINEPLKQVQEIKNWLGL